MNKEYPIEIVASIAAHLLKGNKYEDAVRRARNIITEVWKQEENAKRVAEEEQVRNAKADRELDKKRIPFEEALHEITGQDNKKTATKYFGELLQKTFESKLTSDPEPCLSKEYPEEMDERISNKIEFWKAGNFSKNEIEYFRWRYLKAFPRRHQKPRIFKGSKKPKGGKYF